MFKEYGMKAEDSNFLIIDKQGIIRYSATGKIDPGQFDRIKELLFTWFSKDNFPGTPAAGPTAAPGLRGSWPKTR